MRIFGKIFTLYEIIQILHAYMLKCADLPVNMYISIIKKFIGTFIGKFL